MTPNDFHLDCTVHTTLMYHSGETELCDVDWNARWMPLPTYQLLFRSRV